LVDPVIMFREGGPFMYLILLSGFGHVAIAVLQIVFVKKVNLIPLLWASVLCTLMMGMLGSVMGIIVAFEAVAKASAETKQTLMAMGFSIAMFTTAASLMVAIPSAFFTGIVASIVRTVGPGAADPG
jgi:hypothetical protein